MKLFGFPLKGLVTSLLMCICLGLSGCGQKGPLVPPPAAQSSLAR